MFKGQGQTTLLSPLCCPLNIFWPLYLINTKLGAGVALNEHMIPIDFQVTWSKVKVKPIFSAQCVVHSISFDPFTWSIPYLVQELPSMSRWSLLIFRSHVQRSRSNHSSKPSVLSAQYLWPFHLVNTKLCAGVALNEHMIPIDFLITCSKVKVKSLFSAHCVVRSISFDPFSWSIPKLGAGVALNK